MLDMSRLLLRRRKADIPRACPLHIPFPGEGGGGGGVPRSLLLFCKGLQELNNLQLQLQLQLLLMLLLPLHRLYDRAGDGLHRLHEPLDHLLRSRRQGYCSGRRGGSRTVNASLPCKARIEMCMLEHDPAEP